MDTDIQVFPNKKLEKLNFKLNRLRFDLEDARPKLPGFYRDFTYQKEVEPLDWRIVSEKSWVQLVAFDGEPGCEVKAYDISEEIKATKAEIHTEISKLKDDQRPQLGYRAYMRNCQIRSAELSEQKKLKKLANQE